MSKIRVLKAAVIGAVLSLCLTITAFAQVNPATPGEVVSEVKSGAAEYWPYIVGIVLALFTGGLLIVLAKKGARMTRGAISKG